MIRISRLASMPRVNAAPGQRRADSILTTSGLGEEGKNTAGRFEACDSRILAEKTVLIYRIAGWPRREHEVMMTWQPFFQASFMLR